MARVDLISCRGGREISYTALKAVAELMGGRVKDPAEDGEVRAEASRLKAEKNHNLSFAEFKTFQRQQAAEKAAELAKKPRRKKRNKTVN